ncbi:hypothetical protein HK104_005253 [Borealophlyctis nickersoniae]|nr:hypothetical protein HK104_005253 [Borealophlyctis nickersoniae]
MPVLLALSLAVLIAAASPAAAAPTLNARAPTDYPFFPVKGTGDWAGPVARAKQLLQQLTLEEKATIVTGTGWQKGQCVGQIGAVPKIGFKGLCLQDGPVGVRFADGVSVFPASINVAATFDKSLMEANGRLMGAEFRGKGVNVALAPMMNMVRTPEGGRNWEGQGADPYLAAASASLQVKGLQSNGIIATAKHYIGNEQEHARGDSSSNIDDRTLHEMYLPPFEASVKAGAGAAMCAYNLVNGTYACENPYLLQTILKGELDFNGFVMTDWWSAKTAFGSAMGGTDMMMPGGAYYGTDTSLYGPNLVDMVRKNQVPVERVDDMVTRILAAWIRAGQDKGGIPDPDVYFDGYPLTQGRHINVQGDHKNHIRAVGAASAILLKNEGGVLPLKQGLRSLGVVGLDAKTPANPNDFRDGNGGGVNGTVALGWGSGTAYFPYLVGPYDGIYAQAQPLGINLDARSFDDSNLNAAADIAKRSDVTIVFVFANSGEEFINVYGNQGDRNNLDLWDNGDALIKAVADNSPNTVVVIHGPGAVNMPWINHPNVKSVIMALMPGQESGNGLADVLFGKTNPSGRLPFTINKRPEDYSAHVLYSNNAQIDYKEGLLVDYRYNQAKNIAPLFPFGHGLSYTTFGYSNLRVDKPSAQEATITVDVTNTGKVAGNEVAQLYLSTPAEAGKPFRELKGFEKVWLNAGETKTVTFRVSSRDLSYWNADRKAWVVPRGRFGVAVGASSADVRVQTNLDV